MRITTILPLLMALSSSALPLEQTRGPEGTAEKQVTLDQGTQPHGALQAFSVPLHSRRHQHTAAGTPKHSSSLLSKRRPAPGRQKDAPKSSPMDAQYGHRVQGGRVMKPQPQENARTDQDIKDKMDIHNILAGGFAGQAPE